MGHPNFGFWAESLKSGTHAPLFINFVRMKAVSASSYAPCRGMDASLYKDYILVLLFIKYISDKFAKSPIQKAKIKHKSHGSDVSLHQTDISQALSFKF